MGHHFRKTLLYFELISLAWSNLYDPHIDIYALNAIRKAQLVHHFSSLHYHKRNPIPHTLTSSLKIRSLPNGIIVKGRIALVLYHRRQSVGRVKFMLLDVSLIARFKVKR